MVEFTIIIPVYNEEENLLQVEKALLQFIHTCQKSTCVLFVNDGSKDNSENIIQAICSRNSNFYFISFKKNEGLSSALKAGIDWAESPLLGYMDSDLQTDPNDFNILLEQIEFYDLVNGIRMGRKDTVLKKVSSKFANRFRRLFTKDTMLDTGCPLKVMKTTVAQNIPMFKGLHRFLPAMVLLQGGKIHQIPVRHRARRAGKTNFGISNRIFGPLITCFAYLWMKRNYIQYEITKKSGPRTSKLL